MASSGSQSSSEAAVSVKLEPEDDSDTCQIDIPLFSHSVQIKREIDSEDQTQNKTNSLEKSQDKQSIVNNIITKLMLEYKRNGYTKWPKVVATPLRDCAKNIKQRREDITSITVKQEKYYTVNENDDVVNPTDPLLEVSHEMMYKGNHLSNPDIEDDKSEVLKAIERMDEEFQSGSDEENRSKVKRKEQPRRKKRKQTAGKAVLEKKKKDSKKPSKLTGRKWSYYSDTDIKEPDEDPYEDSGSDNWEPKLDEEYLANVERAMRKAYNNKNKRVWINLDEIYLD